MLGIAGMIAEAVWDDPDMLDCVDDLLLDPECMSESDRRKAGLDFDERLNEEQRCQIEAVIDLLRGPLRSELFRQARKIIVEARDFDT
jgi:hypothetical protein